MEASSTVELRGPPDGYTPSASSFTLATIHAQSQTHLTEVKSSRTEEVTTHQAAYMDSRPVEIGGRAWLVILGSFCCLCASFGWISSGGVFENYYQETLLAKYSPRTIAWISSVGFFLMYFMAVFVGKLCSMYGPRSVLFIGSVLHVGGLIAASFSTKYYQLLLAQGICSPCGASAVFYASVTTMTAWFSKRQGLAIGISAAGASVGGVIFPIMTNTLLPKIGFAWTLRAAALCIFILLAVAMFTVRLPPVRRPQPIMPINYLAPFRSAQFLYTAFGAACFVFGYFTILTFVVSCAHKHGMAEAINALVVLNGSSFFGRIFPGLVADVLGRLNTIVAMTLLSGILTLACWIPATSAPVLVLFSALYGFASGCIVSLTPAVVVQISPAREAGYRIGLVYAVMSVAALTGAPIGGALLDGYEGRYQLLQAFCGIMQLGGSLLFVLARIQQPGLWA